MAFIEVLESNGRGHTAAIKNFDFTKFDDHPTIPPAVFAASAGMQPALGE